MLAILVVISHPGNIVVIPDGHSTDFGILKRETIPEAKFGHILSIYSFEQLHGAIMEHLFWDLAFYC